MLEDGSGFRAAAVAVASCARHVVGSSGVKPKKRKSSVSQDGIMNAFDAILRLECFALRDSNNVESG